jgi:ribonuclease P protein component
VSDFGFSKKLRLLGAADYQPVFKNARYKVSSQYILILAVANNLARPRIGLVIAKKNVAKAVQRNRVKRIFRESFRHNQRLLPALDIVILARSGLDSLSNELVHTNIERLWLELTNKTRRSSVTRDQANAG